MTSTTTDRRMGLVGSIAFKAPCDCATTGNITLSGEQSIDGVTTSTSRVLVMHQTNGVENGIYDSSSAAWTRAIDCDGTYDLACGSTVYVTHGSTLAGSFYTVTTVDPITIGSTSIAWATSVAAGNLATQLADTSAVGLGDALVGVKSPLTGAVGTTQHEVNARVNCAFDYMTAAQIADVKANTHLVDVTAALQQAITNGGAGGSTWMPAGTYLVSNLTIPAAHRLFGDGRQQTNLYVAAGTTGVVIEDSGNAAKIILEDFAVYANNEPGLTDIIKLGYTIQFGTEGYLRGLWLRDAPNAKGLNVNANVGIFDTITVQNCSTNFYILGSANFATTLVSVAAKAYGAFLFGTMVKNLEIEATDSGQVPLHMYGDVAIIGLYLATTAGYTFDTLIEVDNSIYSDSFSLSDVQLLGSGYTVNSGILKIGSSYYGGTNPNDFNYNYNPKFSIIDGVFELKFQQMQCFTLRVTNTGGTMQHAIILSGDATYLPVFSNKITAASNTLQNTPTGADASTAMAYGGKISSAATNIFILDTAAQIATDQIFLASISINTSTTQITVQPTFTSRDVNGTTRVRLELNFYKASDGSAFALTTANIAAGKIVDILFLGCLA